MFLETDYGRSEIVDVQEWDDGRALVRLGGGQALLLFPEDAERLKVRDSLHMFTPLYPPILVPVVRMDLPDGVDADELPAGFPAPLARPGALIGSLAG